MPIISETPTRFVVKSGSTTLTLDKDAGKAVMNRKLLFWPLKPAEMNLSEVSDFTVDAAVDRASGVEVCNTMVVTQGGAAWALPAADKKEAQANADAMRTFLGFRT